VSKPKKDKSQAAELTRSGMVLYTDGGARPTNPGFAGYGFHGYTYNDTATTKGTGLGHWAVTADGYVDKRAVKDNAKQPGQVSALEYVDGFGCVPGVVSNNVAEVAAATWALEYAKQNPAPIVKIYSDSKGTVEAVNNHLDNWAARGWIKSDGRPVANIEYLKKLSQTLKEVRDAGTKVEFNWIRSHNGHIGNEASDHLATMGVLRSMAEEGKVDYHYRDTAQASGYWTKKSSRHPLVSMRCVYVLTQAGSSQPCEYYTGNHGKIDNDADCGMPCPDGRYSYVVTKEPDHVLDYLRTHVESLSTDQVRICYIHTPRFYHNDIYPQIERHGAACLYHPRRKFLDLYYVDKTPVVVEFNPPILAYRAIEELNHLKALHLAWQAREEHLTITEITDQIYMTDAKGKTSLKDTVTSGSCEIKVPFISQPQSPKVPMLLGHDVVDRNTLKRVETNNPKVYLLTWREGPGRIRFAGALECDLGTVVTAGVYSNNLWCETQK
jgi:ribonuclease HI